MANYGHHTIEGKGLRTKLIEMGALEATDRENMYRIDKSIVHPAEWAEMYEKLTKMGIDPENCRYDFVFSENSDEIKYNVRHTTDNTIIYMISIAFPDEEFECSDSYELEYCIEYTVKNGEVIRYKAEEKPVEVF